ncbi:hypothetical protein AMS68_003109 [Peltaster fructicola]|uniref:Uncharacterized protein n=1 Tax=Peltaster fructicola TaxID=286661 RepID=A0A6H0XS50_9PEZI|nr:hypothetical protein AMS68_003109 [Peltaster fructicola]
MTSTVSIPTPSLQDPLPVSSGAGEKQTQSIGGVQDPGAQQSLGGKQDPATPSDVQSVPVSSDLAGVQTRSVGNVQDPAAPASPNTAIVESKTFVVVSVSTGVVVAVSGMTTTFGAGVTTSLAGEQVNIPSSGAVVIGTGSVAKTVAFTTSIAGPQQTVVTVGSEEVTFAPASSGGVVVANGGSTATVALGGLATIGGQQVGVAPSGSVVLGSGGSASTIALPPAPTTVVAGGQSVTLAQAPNGAGVVVANGGTTTTVTPGAAAVTVGGQQVSIAIGDSVVVGTGNSATTIFLVHTPVSSTAFIIGSETVTILPASGATGVIVVDHSTTKTIQAGSVVTIDGQRLSAGSGVAVIGTGTLPATIAVFSPSIDQTIVIGSQTVTLVRVSTGVIVVDRGNPTTIAAGAVATIEGQRVSVGVNGLVAVGTGSTASTISVRVDTHISSSTNVVSSMYKTRSTSTTSSTESSRPIEQATLPLLSVSTQQASSTQQSTSGVAVLPGQGSMMRATSCVPMLVGVLMLPLMLEALPL